jgi:hypothetical protein
MSESLSGEEGKPEVWELVGSHALANVASAELAAHAICQAYDFGALVYAAKAPGAQRPDGGG